ncbi:hypothetical protein PHYC_01650 [Phycisphaerales bacterium]|nr:hypothetical protein PHYC_01650 [Phycisphaerales bacterium]
MSPAVVIKPVSPLTEILKWSVNRPDWQRDALRRIVSTAQVAPTDIDELERLCRHKHVELDEGESPPAADFLAATHLPTRGAGTPGVSLVSLGNLQNVNRIPSDQTLPFGPNPGLAVIYGDNGSGKSGYARVIKKACRARGQAAPILPDVTANAPPGKAAARFTIRDGPAEPTIDWTDGVAADARLGQVFLFDAACADHYVHEDAGAAFTPFGLDILDKLSRLCDEVRQKLNTRHNALSAETTATAAGWKVSPATPVGKLIAKLNCDTPASDIETAAKWTDADADRLSVVRETLASDPKIKAGQTRAAASRIQEFRQKLETTASRLSDSAIGGLRTAMDDAGTSRRAAEALATGKFDESFLPGTGGSVWKTLWDAAREYSSKIAYPDQDYPVHGEGARCVLCQTNLDSEAKSRMKRFDDYIEDAATKLAATNAQHLKELVDQINELPRLADEKKKVDDDLAAADKDLRATVHAFVAAADDRLVAVRKAPQEAAWSALPPSTASPATTLIALYDALTKRAQGEAAADDPIQRQKLMDERDDLQDRQWLAGAKDEVLRQIDRHKALERLRACIDDTDTTKITNKSTELTDLLVTGVFRDRFKSELKALGLRTLKVELKKTGGQKGVGRFGVRLQVGSSAGVAQVGSEGEKRCIALALFLAELSQASHQSTLVFDDPVSSLDHWHRELIAKRLVEEAKARQVIVFTHDPVLLHELCTSAVRASAPISVGNLQWAGNIPGVWQDGLPWKWKTPDERFDAMEKRQREIAKTCSVQPTESDELSIRNAYSSLRATLERMIEHDIFGDAVFRFRTYIDVKKVEAVVGFSQTEFDELSRLHKRCCDVTEAHDPAQGQHSTIPTPQNLARDIADSKALLTQVRSRRKLIEQQRKTPPLTVYVKQTGSVTPSAS